MLRKILLPLLLLLQLLAAGASFAAAPVDIVSAEFGVFTTGEDEERVFSPGEVIPLVPGQRYGWVLEVRSPRRSVSVREEALLAGAPVKAGDHETITFERRRLLGQRQLVPVGGRIFGEWTVGPDDRPGPRQLRVTVEEQSSVEFSYELRPPGTRAP